MEVCTYSANKTYFPYWIIYNLIKSINQSWSKYFDSKLTNTSCRNRILQINVFSKTSDCDLQAHRTPTLQFDSWM